MQKILFLASNPEPTVQLDLLKQFSQIQSSINSSPLRDFTLELAHAVLADDLVNTLREHKPAILHFSGHATQAGLVVDGSDRLVLQVPLQLVGGVLEKWSDPPRLVVLTACHTGAPPRELKRAVDFVIGMKGEVRQSSAITFVDTLYAGLARGESVGLAFDLAAKAMKIGHPEEDARPQLSGRKHPQAGSTVLTRQPAIAAEFLTDPPKKKGNAYEVRLKIRNAPDDAYVAVYQLTKGYGPDEYSQVGSGEKDFELLIDYWEDFEAKVVLWSPQGGVCVKRRVLEALQERYPQPSPSQVKAMNYLVTA